VFGRYAGKHFQFPSLSIALLNCRVAFLHHPHFIHQSRPSSLEHTQDDTAFA
jgi:hypothetical protein